MFFIETSGRSWLTPREACTLESAEKFSNLDINMIFVAKELDLNDNSTCYLYQNSKKIRKKLKILKNLILLLTLSPFRSDNWSNEIHIFKFLLSFYTINITEAVKNTPIENLYNLPEFKSSPNRMTHLSDSLRLVLIYKFGGFYSDIDMIVIKDMSKLRNVFANIGVRHIPNGEFQLEKNHRIMLPILTKIKEEYKGQGRTEIGPLFGKIKSIWIK